MRRQYETPGVFSSRREPVCLAARMLQASRLCWHLVCIRSAGMQANHPMENPPSSAQAAGDDSSDDTQNEITPEDREREAAYRRGEARERERAEGKWTG